MKILHISSGDFFSTYGGGQVYVKNIAEEMVKHDDIYILSFVDTPHATNAQKYKGITIFEVANNCINIDSVVLKISPDIIHAHGHKALACTSGKRLGIPVVVTAHHGGIVCPGGALLDSDDKICEKTVCYHNCLPCVLRNIRSGVHWYPIMKLLPERTYIRLGQFLQNKSFIPFITPICQAAMCIRDKKSEWDLIVADCAKMIAPCHAIADAMVRNGLDNSKVAIIPHGIPIPAMSTTDITIKSNLIKFFYVGRICYVKGIHILLKAFTLFKDTDVELHLIGGAGNKAEYRYMKNLQQHTKNDNRIIWHGKLNHDETIKLIQSFDISIVPTICVEIFGLNIAEALATGKPVIATQCGGAEMQIEDGINGWLVEPNNIVDLNHKIKIAAKEYKKLNKQTICDNVISIEKHCEVLKKVYQTLLR